VNSFYTGKKRPPDIAVKAAIKAIPSLLAARRMARRAITRPPSAIAGLESAKLPGVGGASLKEKYQSLVNEIAVAASDAKTDSEATARREGTLEAQR
jgi:hypothetical protein